MSIFDRMQQLTKGKAEKEQLEIDKKSVAVPGDTITGIITNIPYDERTKKLKGYFFISSESLPFERIFAHWSGLRQDTLRMPELRKRMRVEFELKHDDENGFKAVKIKVLE